jgi:hypothetical protein
MMTIAEKFQDMLKGWPAPPDPETLGVLEAVFTAGAVSGLVLARQALTAAGQDSEALNPLMMQTISTVLKQRS